MKNKRYNYSVIALLTAIMLVWSVSCTRDFDELELAKFPNTPEVFIDGFSAGLNYAAFGGSKVTAFDVDEEVKFSGSASMKIEVPDAGDPEGAYAGGVYFTTVGRNLSDYDALTFWAKGSKSATIDLVGFGNDLGESKYLVSMQNVAVNSNWKKYIIPIPDASKLTEERGMFYYSEGPEEGLGYTFWVDEVKFEKLGTLAHMKPMILDGEDETESAVNGLSFPLGGLSVSFNMPTGIDQVVIAAPAWFTFSSSNASVASVDAKGMINVLSAGTSVITATLGNEDATGSLTVTSSGDFTHAPAPTAAQEDVISIFSDAYTSVPVEFFNGYWEPYQTTTSADFTVGEDDVLFYNNFNFVGIQFSSPSIDATSMTHLHMDVWIPNAVDPADKLQITVKDMGPDGTLNDGNDPSITYIVPTPMASQSWISVDIDLSGLPSKSKLAQLVLENLGTGLSGFYLDNIYLYGDGGGTPAGPTEAAPTPPARNAADVISIYGDAYTNLAGTDFPFWGQATVVSDVLIEGNNTLKFTGLNFQGIQLAGAQDVSGMESLHLDFWTANSSSLNVYLISTGPTETAYALTVPTTGWSSVDIPMSGFSGVDLADVIQMKFDGNGDIYLDNIYFFKTGGGTTTEPTTAPETPPARDAADVISVYGEAYGAEIGLANVDWDNGSGFVEETIASNKLLKIDFVDFLGTQLNSVVDATAMTHFHMDIWIADDFEAGQIFNPKWSNHAGGAGETNAFELTYPVGDTDLKKWISIDVPITDFTGDNTRANLTQFLIAVAGKIDLAYVDNIYFYKDGGGGSCDDPIAAPPAPTQDAADVISIFSDAYTNIAGTNFNPTWGQSTVVTTESIGGGSTLKYDVFNYQGTNLGGADGVDQDLSSMEYLHIDMWTCDATVVQMTPISRTTGEHLVSLTPITAGQWNSYDIPLSDFTGVSMADIFQLKFDGQAGVTPSKIFIDNVYFYKTGGATGGPATAAPTPTHDPLDVVSIYSDAYTDITIDNFDAGWCGGAAVTEVTIAGNNTLKKNAGIDCHGISFTSNRQNLTDYTHIHFDFYTDDVDLTGDVFNVKLVDFAGTAGEVTALEVNINTGTTPGIVSGTWISVDVDITALGGVVANNLTRSDVAQIGITTANLTNVWYDNIYLHK